MELLPLLLIFAVMMLPLMWMSSRQRKAQQKQRDLVGALGVGDEVRTHSGFYGLIVEAYDDVVVLESEDGTQSKWARQAIAMAVEEPAAEPTEDEAGTEDQAVAAGAVDGSEQERTEGSSAASEVPGVTVTEDVARDADRRDR
ncbi:preprotein translocase subunit YajC [Brachybacterium sp. J153]|uniref:preprotein translocase subunit YajC n=1 Tax=Brachybacterium sp. J153 TaxID=3116488 RepID=UPI002E7625C5|nr:preprotein translocase subunit YajC [Brachybacterium sp. J153]MEE1617643.1 preprotein translocase subunit YajC [Brachybacterium sp. J153]